jgi:hypothetical protein
VRPGLLRNKQLSGGLIMFFFQYLVQAGLFFVVPLFLSVCLGLSALETGARLLLPSVTLLLAAIGIPRFLPDISPRLVVPITAFPSSRTPTSRRASRKPALARRRPTLRSRLRGRSDRRAPVRVSDPRCARSRRAFLHAANPVHAAGSGVREGVTRMLLRRHVGRNLTPR